MRERSGSCEPHGGGDLVLTEAAAMDRAVALAWRGWGRVAPNPMVGCVLVANGAIVAEGWHAEFGQAHAEQMALAAAGPAARGATAFVTLEPCAHVGQQPSCADALIAAGIARVVAAVPDPNPIAAGGAARLRDAGIAVDTGVGSAAARYQLAPFLHQHLGLPRPWVVLKLATSVDGRIADAGGKSQWISGLEAREWVHWLRGGFDAIGVGGATVAADDPMLTVRSPVAPRVAPRRVVFSGRNGVAADRRLLATAREHQTTIVAPPGTPSRVKWETAGATVVEAADLASALEQLWLAGVTTLLVEGGGRLAGGLLAQRLIDRVGLIQAPLFLGSSGAAAVSGWDAPSLADSDRWQVVERRALGADSLLVLDRS